MNNPGVDIKKNFGPYEEVEVFLGYKKLKQLIFLSLLY